MNRMHFNKMYGVFIQVKCFPVISLYPVKEKCINESILMRDSCISLHKPHVNYPTGNRNGPKRTGNDLIDPHYGGVNLPRDRAECE